MAFGLDLSTLGNLGRAASRGIAQNTAFNEQQRLLSEQQRLLGGQEADKAASKLLLKAAVDPTPENIQAAVLAMQAEGVSQKLVTPSISILQRLSQVGPKKAEAQRLQTGAGLRGQLAAREGSPTQDQRTRGEAQVLREGIADIEGGGEGHVGLERMMQIRKQTSRTIAQEKADAASDPSNFKSVDGRLFNLKTQEFITEKDPDLRWDPTNRVMVDEATGQLFPMSEKSQEILTLGEKKKRLGASAQKTVDTAETMRGMTNQLVGMLQDKKTRDVLDDYMGATLGKSWNRITALEGGVGFMHHLANIGLPEAAEYEVKPSELVAFETLLTKMKDTYGRIATGMRIAPEEYVVFDAIVGTLDMTPDIALQKLIQLSDQLTRSIRFIEEGGGSSGGSISVNVQDLERRAANDPAALEELKAAALDHGGEAMEAYERVMTRGR
jgi:hypothetical protein